MHFCLAMPKLYMTLHTSRAKSVRYAYLLTVNCQEAWHPRADCQTNKSLCIPKEWNVGIFPLIFIPQVYSSTIQNRYKTLCNSDRSVSPVYGPKDGRRSARHVWSVAVSTRSHNACHRGTPKPGSHPPTGFAGPWVVVFIGPQSAILLEFPWAGRSDPPLTIYRRENI